MSKSVNSRLTLWSMTFALNLFLSSFSPVLALTIQKLRISKDQNEEILARNRRSYWDFDPGQDIAYQLAPDTFWEMFMGGTSVFIMVTIAKLVAGSIYETVVNSASGEYKKYLEESFDYLNAKETEDWIWIGVMIFSTEIIGRIFVMFLGWGPGYTISKIKERTANEIANIPFGEEFTKRTFGIFVLETWYISVGLFFSALIGESGIIDILIPPTPTIDDKSLEDMGGLQADFD